MNARRCYALVRWLGWALLGLVLVFFLVSARSQWKRMQAATPHLNGEPGQLRELLGFPWKDFPSIPAVERAKLEELVPIDPPLRVNDVRPWLHDPTAPALGAGEARRNGDLQAALRIMDAIARSRAEATDQPPADAAANEARSKIAEAKERLGAAERSASRDLAWLISYNRGVLYLWGENRQKAAKDFNEAYANLRRRLEATSSEEVLSAGVHVLYALGNSRIDEGDKSAGNARIDVPDDALHNLREAVILAVRIFAVSHPHGTAHAAEFFELNPTGLSTRALRNDLLAAYLLRPDFKQCPEKMSADACNQKQYDIRDRCGYRDSLFCGTVNKASNRLSGVYKRELERYIAGETKEGTLWALQTAAEMEAENKLDQDSVVSYNLAHLLLTLQRPDLAYSYVYPAVTRGDEKNVDAQIERLTFVTSILSGAQPTAISEGTDADAGQSEYRKAYMDLYKDTTDPEPFRPLHVGDVQRAHSLDAWLFVRRYRYLLERGQLETFLDEHRRLMATNAPRNFLPRWKTAVIVEFLTNVKKVRDHAQPDGVALIDRFLERSDLFSREELKAAGLSAPFWTPRRALVTRIASLLLLWLVLLFLHFWLCTAYSWTFLSAYRTDREAAANAE